jgi:hypothetical protein
MTIALQWLDVFRKANQGDRASQAVLSRYDRMIAFRKEKEHWKEIFRKEAASRIALPFVVV